MEKYENLGMVGEGSYGVVIKCRHKESGQVVAIKKFLDTEDDRTVKKIAMREIRMLKQLQHENLVNLIEVFRKKKRLYLVFEYVDHTVLDELERHPNGLDEASAKKLLFQVIRGTEFCHMNNVIHRDVKPENILVSKLGVVKLCDFGFARPLAPPGQSHTDYVATRWYRAPELLVGDTKYGKPVDVWAVGCLFAEMLTSEPLFPGESDLDQLYHILRCFGSIASRHREVFYKNNLFAGKRLPEPKETTPLEHRVPKASPLAMDLLKQCLLLEPDDRPSCAQLLRHDFFQRDDWASRFVEELRLRVQREIETNPLLRQNPPQYQYMQTSAHTPQQSAPAPAPLPVAAAVAAAAQATPEREVRNSSNAAQPSKATNGASVKKVPIQVKMQLMLQPRKSQQPLPSKRDSPHEENENVAEDREAELPVAEADVAKASAEPDVEVRDKEREKDRPNGLSLPPALQPAASRSPAAYYFGQPSVKSQEKPKKVNNIPIQFTNKNKSIPQPQSSYYQSLMNYHTMNHQSESRQSNFLQFSTQSQFRKSDSLLPEVRGSDPNRNLQLSLFKFKKGFYDSSDENRS